MSIKDKDKVMTATRFVVAVMALILILFGFRPMASSCR